MTPRPDVHRIRPARRTVLSLACAAALAGCAGLAPPSGQVLSDRQVPPAWSASTATLAPGDPMALAAWWQRFDDPALTALVARALQANPGVMGGQAALLQARAQADVQQARLAPTLGAAFSAQRSDAGNQPATSRYQAGLDAGWEVDVFGGNRSAARASDTDARAAAASLSNVQVSLAAEVALTYLNLRGQQARLAIARRNLATQLDTLQITRWRAQAGLVSSLDVAQAVSAAEQTRAQVPALEAGAVQALNALAALTGRARGALENALGADAAIPQAPPDLALSLPADVLRQRPDVQAAELRAQAALERVAVADAARRPAFRLSGSLGLSALTLGTLTHGASVLSSLLAGVSAPLLDGGASQAQVRAQQAALEQARASYESAVLAAVQEVEDALVALRGDRERLERLQAASAAAAHAELLARHRYGSGLIDFPALLAAQRTLLSVQDSVAGTQASLGADHVRLYKALGGGWQPGTDARPCPAALADGASSPAPARP